MATVFEVRDEISKIVEPMIPPVKVPERLPTLPSGPGGCVDPPYQPVVGGAWTMVNCWAASRP